MSDYASAIKNDLLEQFKGKPNIEALANAIGAQLDEVHGFLEQLLTDRTIETAVGAQLDGIGDIEVLNRVEAGIMTGMEDGMLPYDVLSDDLYRQYLIWKIIKNTTRTTYPDIIKALKMFWDEPLYYMEDVNEPATMIFDTGYMDGPIDLSPLYEAPALRAAGVTLKIYGRQQQNAPDAEIKVYSGLGLGYSQSAFPTNPNIYINNGMLCIDDLSGFHMSDGVLYCDTSNATLTEGCLELRN